MTLLDANLLVYSQVSSMPQHARARTWFDAHLNSQPRVGMSWPSLLAFLRLVSNPRIFTRPQPLAAAWQRVETWLARPNVWIPQPTDEHAELFGKLLRLAGQRSNLVPDVHLAALAMEHGLTLCSADGDFARFPQLKWENPLG